RREGAAGSTGEDGRPRRRRSSGPKPDAAVASVADAGTAAVGTNPSTAQGGAVDAAGADPSKPPRKRRRRRGGRKLENGESVQAQQAGAESSARPTKPKAASRPAATAPAASSPSLLSRIGLGLKRLVTRAPSNQH